MAQASALSENALEAMAMNIPKEIPILMLCSDLSAQLKQLDGILDEEQKQQARNESEEYQGFSLLKKVPLDSNPN